MAATTEKILAIGGGADLHRALDHVLDRVCGAGRDASTDNLRRSTKYGASDGTVKFAKMGDAAGKLHRALDAVLDRVLGRDANASDDDYARRRDILSNSIKAAELAMRNERAKGKSGTAASKEAFKALQELKKLDAEHGADACATDSFIREHNGWEYWLAGGEVYRNQAGNRGPMEGGKPSNARWECSQAHFERFKTLFGGDAKAADGKYEGALRGLTPAQQDEVVKHADKIFYAMLDEGYDRKQADEFASVAAKNKAHAVRLRRPQTADGLESERTSDAVAV